MPSDLQFDKIRTHIKEGKKEAKMNAEDNAEAEEESKDEGEDGTSNVKTDAAAKGGAEKIGKMQLLKSGKVRFVTNWGKVYGTRNEKCVV